MNNYRRLAETTRASAQPEPGQFVEGTSAFLRQLIALPISQFVGSLPVTPLSEPTVQPSVVPNTLPPLSDPVAAIVNQVASILDEEMARGLLAARSASGTTPFGDSNASHPVLRQMHAVVDNLAALWPQIQSGAVGATTHRATGDDSTAPITVKPSKTVVPGGRAIISMTLRNSESRSVRLVPIATDLIGRWDGWIAGSLCEFAPSEMVLAPGEQKELTISTAIPVDAAPGYYTGLLVVRGLDYLQALIEIEIANTTGASKSVQLAPRLSALGASTLTPRTTQSAAVQPPTLGNSMVQEAMRLAEDGELGNSDAIRLLQMPHSAEEVREVLRRCEKQLSGEARSKLNLDAFAPMPDGVDNQRFEPIFDRYPITGKTYATAKGAVVVNEVQYYNGEMVQLYGECSNVARVREALAGSGYKPVTMKHVDGRESAVAQFWSHELTDTSLRPYNAAFIIVAVMPEDTPADRAYVAADANGVSSALVMFDGAFDPTRRVYENRVHLFYLRLLDSTQIAIDFGRERMGTDKRPGSIQILREGRRRSFSVKDGAGVPVASIDFEIADDTGACLCEISNAAASAGVAVLAPSPGIEYVFPGAARIGRGPVVTWQWRTDILPRLQRVEANTANFDVRSEEGAILTRWGFKPQVLGYIPNVRGVVTGVV